MTFTNAKIAGIQVSQTVYRGHGKKRGDKDYPIGSSDLRRIGNNPHKWRFSPEDEESGEMTWGTLVDALLLRPLGQDLPPEIAIHPETYADTKTGEQKPWNWNSNTAKAWKKANSDKTIVSMATIEKAKLACRTVMENDTARSVVKSAS